MLDEGRLQTDFVSGRDVTKARLGEVVADVNAAGVRNGFWGHAAVEEGTVAEAFD